MYFRFINTLCINREAIIEIRRDERAVASCVAAATYAAIATLGHPTTNSRRLFIIHNLKTSPSRPHNTTTCPITRYNDRAPRTRVWTPQAT